MELYYYVQNKSQIIIEQFLSYANNKVVTTGSSLATMTIKGKGNYAGMITISFPILKASLSENENLTAAVTPIAYNAEKADDYQYRPQIKLMAQKKVLSASKDYDVVEEWSNVKNGGI